MLYRITRLNANYLNISLKKKLRLSAQKSIIKECESLQLDEETIKKLISKARRRNTKTAFKSLIKDEVLKYIKDQDSYEMPSKQ